MNHTCVKSIIKAIRFYQRHAPGWIRKMCRYNPSCSEYAIIVLREKGAVKGSLLAAARILRCFPPFGGDDWPKDHKHSCRTNNNRLNK